MGALIKFLSQRDWGHVLDCERRFSFNGSLSSTTVSDVLEKYLILQIKEDFGRTTPSVLIKSSKRMVELLPIPCLRT